MSNNDFYVPVCWVYTVANKKQYQILRTCLTFSIFLKFEWNNYSCYRLRKKEASFKNTAWMNKTNIQYKAPNLFLFFTANISFYLQIKDELINYSLDKYPIYLKLYKNKVIQSHMNLEKKTFTRLILLNQFN